MLWCGHSSCPHALVWPLELEIWTTTLQCGLSGWRHASRYGLHRFVVASQVGYGPLLFVVAF